MDIKYIDFTVFDFSYVLKTGEEANSQNKNTYVQVRC
jgi:hypothetical protein